MPADLSFLFSIEWKAVIRSRFCVTSPNALNVRTSESEQSKNYWRIGNPTLQIPLAELLHHKKPRSVAAAFKRQPLTYPI